MAAPHQPPEPRRRGRRRAGRDTRAQLLDAARVEFRERGYDGATVRMIADRAGVDAAMVNHWFGGKEALFTASLDLPLDPGVILADILPGPPEQLGERIVSRFLAEWDDTGGGSLVAVLQSVTSHEDAARMLREFVIRVLIGRIVAGVSTDRVELRASLCGSQIIGLAMARYVLKLEPLASADRAVVVAAIAPTLQRYLTGPLT